ncbi:hypothetical protein EKM05_13675 [Flavobacterium sp. GSP27]|uniref:hypothetical protein n=1 Tax=unclassified Flavobacterium TaxID=196869 RepID=UPI000F81BEFF|nr:MULTISPECIES: hypothetical protein [unclassified Flavobacterium]RTY77972.1 hypothetical protein EKL97_14710 [Flavobacterium sp. LS1P28]RTZ05270.1 hypothetical protein EKM05_13675 [Flavobacterium sp. GSP27]
MKARNFIVVAFFGFIIISCNVIDDLLTFSIDNQTTVTIPSGFPVNTSLELVTPDVPSNSSTAFENNNTNAELVKDVKLKEMKLTVTNPANKSFSFLKSIHIYISTNDSDEIELAFLDDINATSNTLSLTCTTEKLDKYVKASSFKLRTKAITKEAITQDISIKADMKFQVTADPF